MPIHNSDNVTDATSGSTIQVAAPFVSLSASGASVKPSAIKLKKSGTLTVTLTNACNVATSGTAAIDIGVSSDGQTEAFPLIKVSKAIKLKPSRSLVLHLHCTVPATATAGMYQPFVYIAQDPYERSGVIYAQIDRLGARSPRILRHLML
jgi:hypothetical protein